MPSISKIADELRKYALGFPEAWEDFPWEHQVVKVRKKIFVFCDNDGNKTLNVTVNAPNDQIQGLYQIVDVDNGGISNETMVRPGTN